MRRTGICSALMVWVVTALLLLVGKTNGEGVQQLQQQENTNHGQGLRAVKRRKDQVMKKKRRYHDDSMKMGMSLSLKKGMPAPAMSTIRMMMRKQMMMMRNMGTSKSQVALPKMMNFQKPPTMDPTPAPSSVAPTTQQPSSPLVPTALPTIVLEQDDYGRCLIAMAIADINRDNVLNRVEYIRFLNRLTQDAYAGVLFQDLNPTLLRDNYEFLADEGSGGIDVRGSKPGQTVENDSHLRRICTYTFTILWEIMALAPKASPNDSSSPPPTAYNPAPCFLSMVISDRNSNDQLDRSEYVVLIQRLSVNAFSQVESFDDLDMLLQRNFSRWAVTGEDWINITGARPNETPTARLVEICRSTQEAIDVMLMSNTTPP